MGSGKFVRAMGTRPVAVWSAAVVMALCALVYLLKAVPGQELPQEEAIARGPRPYTNQEVSFNNDPGPVKLAGTFSVPNGEGPFPAVLLIAASGPEARDENADGHLVFVVLADHLLRQGVAVLRYDKRGVGASTGDFDKATFDDLVSDAAAAFRYLKSRPGCDRPLRGRFNRSSSCCVRQRCRVRRSDGGFGSER